LGRETHLPLLLSGNSACFHAGFTKFAELFSGHRNGASAESCSHDRQFFGRFVPSVAHRQCRLVGLCGAALTCLDVQPLTRRRQAGTLHRAVDALQRNCLVATCSKPARPAAQTASSSRRCPALARYRAASASAAQPPLPCATSSPPSPHRLRPGRPSAANFAIRTLQTDTPLPHK